MSALLTASKRLFLFAIVFTLPVSARVRFWNYCQQGGQIVSTVSIPSTTKVQQSYPGCTVRVNIAGTSTPASIYADDSGTPKSNPFTADTQTGYFFFYAENGTYDLLFSGTGISNFTAGAVSGVDPLNVPKVISDQLYVNAGKTFAQMCLDAQTANETLVISNPWLNIPTQTCGAPALAFYGEGKIQPGTGQSLTISPHYSSGYGQWIFDTTLGGTILFSSPPAPVSPNSWGAKGDRITDDSAAFEGALNSLASEIKADQGVYLVNSRLTLNKNQSIYFGSSAPYAHVLGGLLFTDSTTDNTGTGQTISCAGFDTTTLMLKNNAGGDLISQVNFSSLTLHNSAFGIFKNVIRNCTLDGNKANQSSTSYTVRLYGHAFRLIDLIVQNSYNDGIYSEWGMDSSFATPSNDLEAYYTRIKTIFNNGNGITYRGPHDSIFESVVSYQNGGWGFVSQLLNATYNGSGAHAMHMNTFLNTLGGIDTDAPFDGVDVIGSTATGWGWLMEAGGGVVCAGCQVGAAGINMEIRNGQTTWSGVVAGGTAGVKLNGAGNANLTLNFNSVAGPQIQIVSETAPNVIIGTGTGTTGASLISGTPANADAIFLTISGTGGGNYTQVTGLTLHAGGWAPVLPQSNSTLATIGDSTQTGLFYASNFQASGGLAAAGTVAASAFALGGLAGNGPNWTFGPGPAAGACSPTGSIYSNTTGGSGTTFFVCEGGTWHGK